MPLNAAIGELGDRKSPSMVQGQSGGGLTDEVPQKLKGVRWGVGVPSPMGSLGEVWGGGFAPFLYFFLIFYLKRKERSYVSDGIYNTCHRTYIAILRNTVVDCTSSAVIASDT